MGGSAGGGKSSTICYAVLILSKKFPGYRCAICRKTSPALRLTTFEEMKQTLNREGLVKREPRQTSGYDYELDNMANRLTKDDTIKIPGIRQLNKADIMEIFRIAKGGN